MTKLTALIACLAVLALAPAGAEAKTFTPIPASQFQLTKHGFDKAARQRISQLAAKYPQVGLNRLLADTNRVNTGLRTDLTPRGAFGYSWEGGDNDVSYWTPQGITGNGPGVQAVSWYRGSSGNEEGVRVSFVNRAEGANGEYRFGLLVRPTGGTGFAQVPIHAGGIAWYGRFLFVADTNVGLRVFNLNRVLRVKNRDLDDTGDYRYLIPQIGHYQRNGNFKYSALGLDNSIAGKPALVAGEYQVYEDKDPVTRIARWRIGAKSGMLGRPAASGAWRTGFDQLQGVLTNKGRIFVSSTEGPRGFLYHGRPKRKAQRDRWGAGPEGLYSTNTQLWSLTEHQGARTVWGKTFRSLLAD